MLKRIIPALILITALSVSAMAGMSPHGDQGCAVMDCCKAALSTGHSSANVAVQLCCTVNCTSPLTTGSASTLDFSRHAPVPEHAIVNRPSVNINSSPRVYSTRTSSKNTSPPYLRHLVLLI